MKNAYLSFLIPLLVVGCGTVNEIRQIDNNKFTVSAWYGSMNGSWDRAQADATAKAFQYCSSRGQKLNVLNNSRDGIYGVTPQTSTVIFICEGPVDAGIAFNNRTSDNLNIATNDQKLESIASPSSIANLPTSKRIAFVLGNSAYKTHPLKNSRNDADDMSQTLRDSGFDVIDLRDANLPQMRAALREFGDKLLSYDVGLVYYSGHGVEVKGRNYFIPVNADIMREDEIADQGLDVSLILEKMNTAGKGVNILIVDACRDDPFGRSFRSSSRGLAQMEAPRGTIIAYATSPGKVAADGDGRNSPYTKNLVKAMQQPNKPIEQVFKEVRRAVQEETKNQQTPWENTSLSGDFYFKAAR